MVGRSSAGLQPRASSVHRLAVPGGVRLMAAGCGIRPFDDRLLYAVTARARSGARRRHMHNFHGNYADPLQRMLNALEPESYVAPHRHPGADKIEAFVVLRGRLGVVEFDDGGTVRRAFVLARNGPVQGIEIPPRAWHTILALESGTVVYEMKAGPYDPARAKEHPP